MLGPVHIPVPGVPPACLKQATQHQQPWHHKAPNVSKNQAPLKKPIPSQLSSSLPCSFSLVPFQRWLFTPYVWSLDIQFLQNL